MSIPFSSIFDLPRLSETLGFPVLEWQQVKDPNSTELDVLGCWNIWQVDNLESTGPRDSRIPYRLQLGQSLWLHEFSCFLNPRRQTCLTRGLRRTLN